MKSLITICLLAGLSCSVAAEKLAIVGGKVFTGSEQGTLDSATVLIDNNKIVTVTTSTEVPEGYTAIDATGKYVTPGLIGAYTQLGLVEVSSSAGTVDASVTESLVSSTGAAFDVSYAINPDSTLMAISRVEGVTSAVTGISRSATLFKGQGALITLSGASDSVLKARAFVAVDVGNYGAEANGGSRAAVWVTLNEAISEAVQVTTAAQLSPSSDWHGINSRADVKALKPVVNGTIPLLIFADRAADIRQVISFKKRYPKIKVVLVKGMEAWRVADELAKADIPVIIDPEFNLPGGFDQLGATLANAKRLEEAGVMVAIGMETHNIRLATQHAGNAVAFGMSWDAAMAALTVNPAQIFAMPDGLGTLKKGAQADVVIWSGDPLEVSEAAEMVIINGKQVEMTSRQIKLQQRYQQRAQSEQASQYIR
ncbi:amidohydrolase family protein [Alteromonas lipolytica]|uniref:Amidohydrolase n=1 Tax=Alteromonas lipolytica TaxID=1856405 RepID=A0A1E8FFW2_9ALTE|nr:amidohydrolase family protein [Alteromonas lipolytica]OFI34363.1 amidohydrolase [Alteromonas lipolytica]GGF82123.1 amidohydrolase [Alteromonas lipolytica]